MFPKSSISGAASTPCRPPSECVHARPPPVFQCKKDREEKAHEEAERKKAMEDVEKAEVKGTGVPALFLRARRCVIRKGTADLDKNKTIGHVCSGICNCSRRAITKQKELKDEERTERAALHW